MKQQWSQEEIALLSEMRSKLQDIIDHETMPIEVVNDRRLLRFLRGHHHNVTKACEMYTKFLNWRKHNEVDRIRDDILYGGKSSPLEFPNGAKILDVVPQIVIAHDATDKHGNPISLEQYCFSPDVAMKAVTKEEYLTFLIYMMEYKVLVLEQLSVASEKKNISDLDNTHDHSPYGVMLNCCIIRDVHGFGIEHFGPDGQTIFQGMLGVAVDNYPEMLSKSHIVNAPWLFSVVWVFVRAFLDAATIAKMTISGTDFMPLLTEEIPIESIPTAVGGLYTGHNSSFDFDLRDTGPFYSPCYRFAPMATSSSSISSTSPSPSPSPFSSTSTSSSIEYHNVCETNSSKSNSSEKNNSDVTFTITRSQVQEVQDDF